MTLSVCSGACGVVCAVVVFGAQGCLLDCGGLIILPLTPSLSLIGPLTAYGHSNTKVYFYDI